MMVHKRRRLVHAVVVEHLLLHQAVCCPHDTSHVTVPVNLFAAFGHRIDAQQVEAQAVGNNHVAVHQPAFLFAVMFTIERIVSTQILVEAYP